MFIKLFRRDFAAQRRYHIPALIVLLAITLIDCVNIAILTREISSTSSVSTAEALLNLASFASLYMSIFGLAIVMAFTVFSVYMYFYSTVATDRAYLTFSVPASARSIIFSKLITSILWLLIDLIAYVAAFFLIILTANSGFSGLKNTFDIIGQIFNDIIMSLDVKVSTAVLTLVYSVVNFLSGIMLVYLAIMLSACFVKKHRVLAAVGFTVLINTILSMASSAFGIGSIAGHHTVVSVMESINLFLSVGITGYAVLTAVFFTLTRVLAEKKLDL